MLRTILLVTALLLGSSCATTLHNELSIRYGKVESREVATVKSSLGATGGFRGIRATTDIPDVPREQIEKNIEQALKEATESYTYLIRFADGKSMRVTTDKDFFYRRDCVAVEQGQLLNIRLVEDGLCNDELRAQKSRHLAEIQARQCSLAKRQLILAQTDREADFASEQVRRLCQFSRG